MYYLISYIKFLFLFVKKKSFLFFEKNISRVSSVLDGYTYITWPTSFQCMFENFCHNIIRYFVVVIIVLMHANSLFLCGYL